MAIAHVQNGTAATGSGTATSGSVTLSTATTIGNLVTLTLAIDNSGSYPVTFAATLGTQSMTLADNGEATGAGEACIFYCKATVATTSVHFSWTGGTSPFFWSAQVQEWSGASGALTEANGGGGAPPPANTWSSVLGGNTVSIANPGDLCLGAACVMATGIMTSNIIPSTANGGPSSWTTNQGGSVTSGSERLGLFFSYGLASAANANWYYQGSWTGGTGSNTAASVAATFPALVALSAPAYSNQSNNTGDTVSVTPSTAASGGVGPYAYAVASGTLPAGLSLNSSTGAITGTAHTHQAAGSLTIKVTDSAASVATSSAFTWTVNSNLTVGTTSPLPSGVVGTAYSATLSATGGYGAYSWALTSGTLPSWATLTTSTGMIGGTPTGSAATTSGLVFTVTDAGGNTAASPSLSMTITASGTFIVTNTTLPPGTVGSAYNANLVSAGGAGAVHWSLTSGTLPSWATLNTTSGAITGTPTTTSSNSLTFTATDSASHTAVSPSLNMVITAAASGITHIQALTPVVGSASTATTITGTLGTAATVNNYVMFALAIDSTGTEVSSINATLGSNAFVLPDYASVPGAGSVFMGYTQVTAAATTISVTLNNGVGPFNWVLYADEFSGVAALDDTATADTSPAAGAFSTNGESLQVSAIGDLLYGCALAFASSSPTTMAASTASPAPASWTATTTQVTGDQMTANRSYGLSLATSSNWTFPGTYSPSSGGVSNAMAMSFLARTSSPLTISTASNVTDAVGQQVSFQPAIASGGTPPYTYSVSSGSLPAGLVLNPSTGVVSGTLQTAEAATAITITVTDATGTATLPVGPPSGIVGSLLLNYSGSQLLANWNKVTVGSNQSGGGTYGLDGGGNLVLTTSGVGNNSAELQSPISYGPNIIAEAMVMFTDDGTGAIGGWPAWWMTGPGPWPTTGEIDIIEGLGGDATMNFHYGSAASPQQTGPYPSNPPPNLTPGVWHTGTVVWTPSSIQYYWDGQLEYSVLNNVTSTAMTLLVDITTDPGNPSATPNSMSVQYVRVWSHS